ncbi:MAG: hypothetical protein H0W44_07080 [Gammaproteobacteria bacterium]|nr:hypothetical protein [Gammaproteobacteria bacterium]
MSDKLDIDLSAEMLINYELGKSDENFTLGTASDNTLLASTLVTQARQSLVLLTRELDPKIYDTQAFIEAVKSLALRGRRSEIRILAHYPVKAMRRGHRLLHLQKRLSSFISVKKIHKDYSEYNEAFLVADQQGYIHRQDASRFDGIANFYAPIRCRELLKTFDDIWDKSEPDPELWQLKI